MNPIFVYDVTVWCDKKTKDETVALFNEYAKHWVFQKEACPTTGTLHYQCRISLKAKRRECEIVKSWAAIGWAGCYKIKPTSNDASRNFDYVMKTETRLEGPWADNDPEPPYIPRQVREMGELKGWQKDVAKDIGVWDTRHINCVINSGGNVGKSSLAGYLLAHGKGRKVPPMGSYEDLMKLLLSMPQASFYLIDIPRGIDTKSKEKKGMYAAIESLKDGYVWDNRYEWKERYFDCPNVWVFTNHVPDVTCLSADRWVFWKIEDEANWMNSRLVQFNPLWTPEEIEADKKRREDERWEEIFEHERQAEKKWEQECKRRKIAETDEDPDWHPPYENKQYSIDEFE